MGKSAPVSSGQPVRPARHLRPQSSAYGDPIPIVYGETLIAGNIIWADQFRSHKLPGGSVAGKKSGGFAGIVSYIYTVSLMWCLAEGSTPTPAAPNGTDTLNFGLMRPGDSPVSVKEAKTPLPSEGGLDPNNYSSGGIAQSQQLHGVEPGVKKGKRIWYAGTGKFGKFRGARFHDWGPGPTLPGATYRFVPLPGVDDLPLAFGGVGAFTDKMRASGTTTYAPLQYRGFATCQNWKMNLGANASVPNMGYPLQGLKPFWQTDLGLDTAQDETLTSEVRDAAPDRFIADLLTNVKHGGGWEKIASLLSGYNGSLSDPLLSPFWNDGAASYGAYCRANGLLLSPRLDAALPMSQLLDDLMLITDSAVVFSEGIFKIIPYGDKPATRIIGANTYTFTPSSDPASTYPGANTAIRDTLTFDDFLSGGAKDDPVEAERVGVIPDQQNSSGYFNVVRIEFESRKDGYVKKTLEAKDEAAVQTFGLIARDTITAPAITREELATDIGLRILSRFGEKRTIYKFTVGWWFLHWEPMDLIAIPGAAIDASMAGQSLVVRLTSITKNEKGELECEAERYPKTLAARTGAILSPPVNDDDGGTIFLGYLVGLNNVGTITDAFFIDFQGAKFTADDLFPFINRPEHVYDVAVEDMTVTALSCTLTATSRDTPGSTDLDVYYRLRIMVEGTAYPVGEELWFSSSLDKRMTKTVQGVVPIPAGSRYCLEFRLFNAPGQPHEIGAGSPPYPATPNFNWTIVTE